MSRLSSVNRPLDEEVIVLNEPDNSRITDRYRLLFAKLDLISKKKGQKVIAVTSAVKGEGKTTTTSNLAVVSARDFGKRSLVIDGDFKNPSLAGRFGLEKRPGLLDIIAEGCAFNNTAIEGPVKNLTILTMGNRGKEKGGGRKKHIWASDGIIPILKEVRDLYDYIWIDAPPILPLFDMSVISEAVDGIVLVVRAGETQESVLTQAVKLLDSKKIIGSVLNRVKTGWKDGYYGYDQGYYDSAH